eukprot:scaffold44686_cov58-Phaeocystis_antarctica.AAC.5
MLSRRLSVCVEYHGGHDGRSAKAKRPSAASPNFSQLSARGCTAVGSSTENRTTSRISASPHELTLCRSRRPRRPRRRRDEARQAARAKGC